MANEAFIKFNKVMANRMKYVWNQPDKKNIISPYYTESIQRHRLLFNSLSVEKQLEWNKQIDCDRGDIFMTSAYYQRAMEVFRILFNKVEPLVENAITTDGYDILLPLNYDIRPGPYKSKICIGIEWHLLSNDIILDYMTTDPIKGAITDEDLEQMYDDLIPASSIRFMDDTSPEEIAERVLNEMMV
jgi:hypothetical protein